MSSADAQETLVERGPSPTAPCWALRSPVGGTKADAADVARGPVWAVGRHSDRARAVRRPGPHRRGGADPASVQAQLDPARRLRLRSASGDAARALGTGAGCIGQAGGSPPNGVAQRSAEGADEPLGEGEPVSRRIWEPRCFRSLSSSEAKWWSRRPAFGRSPSKGSLTCTPVALTRSSRRGYQRRGLPSSPDRAGHAPPLHPRRAGPVSGAGTSPAPRSRREPPRVRQRAAAAGRRRQSG